VVGLSDQAARALAEESGGAVASGPSAAALHGFDGFRLRRPLHVTVTRGRNVQRVGFHVRTTSDLPRIDRSIVARIPAMSATRTLIDLARSVGPAELTAAPDSALRDGRTSGDLLHRRIASLRSSGRYGIPNLIDVIEGAENSRGGHSWLERRFLELCVAHGLPRPRHSRCSLAHRTGWCVRPGCLSKSAPPSDALPPEARFASPFLPSTAEDVTQTGAGGQYSGRDHQG